MINFVFFDLDDTLLDFKKAERIAAGKALAKLGLPCADSVLSRYSEINESRWKLLELGLLTRDEVKVERFRLLFDELGTPARPEAAAKIYEDFLSQGCYFIDGAPELLAALSGKYRLYLMSNGTAQVQKGRLSCSGIEHYFERIFISEETGFAKPQREYFESCFSQISGFKKAEAVIIGDSLTSDIAGGRNAGIAALWFSPHGGAPSGAVPDMTVKSLSEIPAALEALGSGGFGV